VTQFWRAKRVVLTGHTGFKGAWTALWLERLGAEIVGIALPPEGDFNLYSLLEPWQRLRSVLLDIRDREGLAAALREADPEIVIHMAAQPIVRRSHRDPVGTFATNVMGTANLLAALEACPRVTAVLVVTSDKVYLNHDRGRPFEEADALGGDDPYSASKAAAELVVRSWRQSFFKGAGPNLATARGGNVIGGGDWGEDRLVPDLIRAGTMGKPLVLRYPNATRPWQFVLDVVRGYLEFAEILATAPREAVPGAINFGPVHAVEVSTGELATRLQAALGWDTAWRRSDEPSIAEKSRLALDSTLAKTRLGWQPRLSVDEALAWIAEWHNAERRHADMRRFSLDQIARYEALAA
jgi:CDP-glucose 4,6-dehydratase